MRIKQYSNVCVGSLFDKCGILHKILKRKYHSNNYVDSKNITIPLLVAICKLDKFGPMINYPHMIDSEQNLFPQSSNIEVKCTGEIREKCKSQLIIESFGTN